MVLYFSFRVIRVIAVGLHTTHMILSQARAIKASLLIGKEWLLSNLLI